MSDGFVILVEFNLKPGCLEPFTAAVRENAALSVRDEPGCRRFDVLTPRDGSERIVLYEIYDGRAAFDAHLETPHYARFKEATQEMIAGRVMLECDLTENAA
jgi:quinol monooxygenase YgiN